MTPTPGTPSATYNGSGDSNKGCEPANPCKRHSWTDRCFPIKALLLLPWEEVLLSALILFYALFSICYQKPVPKCSEKLVQDEVELQKLELDRLLPEVKGRILVHLDYEDILKHKSLSKNWKTSIESVEFNQALSLKAKPVLTACAFFIENGVWQWAAFDPKWTSTSGHRGKWRKLPPMTFLPPNCDPDSDLFKQFLFCAKEGLVCKNFSKSPHEDRLIVFNPLTEQRKELPPLLHRRNPVLMHMYVDQSSKAYHILVAGSSVSGEESLSRITEFYDSGTGQWARVGDLPGPAFALNEYQSGVFQNGNIFCIGFVELGDQTVKGILRYNVEEGIWSMKWTAEALPNSSILMGNDVDLFLFSERDNGPVTEHWVDRIESISIEGDDEEKIDTFSLVNVLKKATSGGRSLEVYPEIALVPFRKSQLCIYNTVNHIWEVFVIGHDHSRSIFLGFSVLHDTIRARMSSAPSLGRSLECYTGLLVVGILSCLGGVGASPASAPEPSSSSSPQVSSPYPTVWYVGIAATIVGTAMAVIALGVKLYNHVREGREKRERRDDSVRGVVDVLTRTFLECPREMCVFVGRLRVGEASVDDLRLEPPG